MLDFVCESGTGAIFGPIEGAISLSTTYLSSLLTPASLIDGQVVTAEDELHMICETLQIPNHFTTIRKMDTHLVRYYLMYMLGSLQRISLQGIESSALPVSSRLAVCTKKSITVLVLFCVYPIELRALQ